MNTTTTISRTGPSQHTSSDTLLLQHLPAHLLEVVQIEGEPLVTLLTQASQLSGGGGGGGGGGNRATVKEDTPVIITTPF